MQATHDVLVGQVYERVEGTGPKTGPGTRFTIERIDTALRRAHWEGDRRDQSFTNLLNLDKYKLVADVSSAKVPAAISSTPQPLVPLSKCTCADDSPGHMDMRCPYFVPPKPIISKKGQSEESIVQVRVELELLRQKKIEDEMAKRGHWLAK